MLPLCLGSLIRYFPQERRPVITPTSKRRAIWTERYTIDRIGMLGDRSAEFAPSRHPTAAPLCPNPRPQTACCVERYAIDCFFMPMERLFESTRLGIPQMQRMVFP